jgi:hypothetical protein
MSFSIAQYSAATDKVSRGNKTLADKTDELVSSANNFMGVWYIPGFIKDAVKWLVEKIVAAAKWVWHEVVELFKGVAAPIYMFKYAWDWEDIKGRASTVAGELTVANVGVSSQWSGSAASAYAGSIAPQNAAATEVGNIANGTALSLTGCAAAGLAFYIALGVIVFQCVAGLVTAIAVLGTGLFAPGGLAIVLQEITITPAMIWAAVGALSALLAAEASQMVTLHGSAVDNSSFPGGHWPHPPVLAS